MPIWPADCSIGASWLRLPKLSIAAKLYAIFALLATVTMLLALAATVSARRHAALTEEFEAAFQGSQNVERINSLIYAVVMESRGVYMSEDAADPEEICRRLAQVQRRDRRAGERLGAHGPARSSEQFKAFAGRVRQFIEFRNELARLGTEVGQAAGREWGDNDANRSVRTALNKDIEALSALYAQQSRDIYAKLDRGIDCHRDADDAAQRRSPCCWRPPAP